MKLVAEKFLKYVSYPTSSGQEREGKCSTDGQYVLAKEMMKELKELGLVDISMNDYGIVKATLKGEYDTCIALLAHMDTSPDAKGSDIKARVIEKYDGKDIVLSKNIIMSPDVFPSLKEQKGQDLIVTDGTTLLGGDDKAGMAIIMTALQEVIKEGLPHHTIEVLFTTDEEIGTGVHHVDTKGLKSKFGYTIDGGCSKYISKSNFNAVNMDVDIVGRNVHPGSAKDKMINAIEIGYEFNSSLPKYERPQYTTQREGFYHLNNIHGSVEEAHLGYIIRDFDKTLLDHRIETVKKVAGELNKKYGYEAVSIKLDYCYKNMEEIIEQNPEVINRVINAYKELNIPYDFEDIRGGTDGAQLSFRGLPCPNLGTGDYNCHGRFEYVSIDEMCDMVKVVKKIITTK